MRTSSRLAAIDALRETEERIKTLLARGDIADDDIATTKRWLRGVQRALKKVSGGGHKKIRKGMMNEDDPVRSAR